MVFVREFYWFKHLKIIKMKKIRRCSVEGEILLGEDSSQQNRTLTYSGKGYYWGTFLRVCFFWVCTLKSPEWELRMSVWPGQTSSIKLFNFHKRGAKKRNATFVCVNLLRFWRPSTFVVKFRGEKSGFWKKVLEAARTTFFLGIVHFLGQKMMPY